MSTVDPNARNGANRAATTTLTGLTPGKSTLTAHGGAAGNARARHLKDKLMTAVMYGAFIFIMLPLVSLMWEVISKGYRMVTPYFLTHSMNGVFGGTGPSGGIYHAIVGTLLITLWAAIISVPIGLLVAVYLVEYGRNNRLSRITTLFMDVMTGIPSIVTGLFAAGLFTLLVGPAYRAGIMGAVALSVLMIPVVIRSSEEMLRLVPNELREASYALGVSRWRTIVKVVLRTAAPGLSTSVIVAIARVIGETAPLLITVGMLPKINSNVFSGRMTTLPVYIYSEYTSTISCRAGQTDCNPLINIERAWGAALVLIALVMVLNIGARLLARYLSPKA